MAKHSTFFIELSKKLLEDINNNYGADNRDAARFGNRQLGLLRLFAERILIRCDKFLHRYGIRVTVEENYASRFDGVMRSYGDGLSYTYSLLADEYSRRALIEVLAYRILGSRHVKLWTNTSEYWRTRDTAASLVYQGREIDTGIDALHLSKTDLRPIGYPISLFTHPRAISHQFLLRQYAYKRTRQPIWISEGDYVIDGGAAWGDTALLFAYEAGERGRIYSFEFEPNNVEVLYKNLKLNEELASRIVVERKALWRDSHSNLGFDPKGPGTRISEAAYGHKENQISSISIDDFADSLPIINFIKMDIEGSEITALKGAEQTIRKHSPKMAISLYHSLSDFVEIPAYLDSLGLDYNFYLDHVSIHSEETVLFAAPSTITD